MSKKSIPSSTHIPILEFDDINDDDFQKVVDFVNHSHIEREKQAAQITFLHEELDSVTNKRLALSADNMEWQIKYKLVNKQLLKLKEENLNLKEDCFNLEEEIKTKDNANKETNRRKKNENVDYICHLISHIEDKDEKILELTEKITSLEQNFLKGKKHTIDGDENGDSLKKKRVNETDTNDDIEKKKVDSDLDETNSDLAGTTSDSAGTTSDSAETTSDLAETTSDSAESTITGINDIGKECSLS